MIYDLVCIFSLQAVCALRPAVPLITGLDIDIDVQCAHTAHQHHLPSIPSPMSMATAYCCCIAYYFNFRTALECALHPKLTTQASAASAINVQICQNGPSSREMHVCAKMTNMWRWLSLLLFGDKPEPVRGRYLQLERLCIWAHFLLPGSWRLLT